MSSKTIKLEKADSSNPNIFLLGKKLDTGITYVENSILMLVC